MYNNNNSDKVRVDTVACPAPMCGERGVMGSLIDRMVKLYRISMASCTHACVSVRVFEREGEM